MDPNHATQPAIPGEPLRTTPLLRWFNPDHCLVSPKLQQKWISLDAQRYEWRDVPFVTEPN